MTIDRDIKLIEAILFASGNPVLENDLKDKIINKKNFDNYMEEIKFSEDETTQIRKKNDFIYSFLSSLRQKINDPLGKRKK